MSTIDQRLRKRREEALAAQPAGVVPAPELPLPAAPAGLRRPDDSFWDQYRMPEPGAPLAPINPAFDAPTVAPQTQESPRSFGELAATAGLKAASFGSNIGRGVGQMPIAITALTDLAYEAATGTPLGATEATRGLVNRAFQTDPSTEGSFLQETVPQALGSSLTFLAGGAVGLGMKGVVGLGATMGSGLLADEAREFGASVGQRALSAGAGGVIGATEAIPVMRFLGRQGSGLSSGLRGMIRAAGSGAVEEAVQESTQTALENRAAKMIFDPERPWNEGLAEAAGAGALTGGLMGGAVSRARTPEWNARRDALAKEFQLPPEVVDAEMVRLVDEQARAQPEAQPEAQPVPEVAPVPEPVSPPQPEPVAAVPVAPPVAPEMEPNLTSMGTPFKTRPAAKSAATKNNAAQPRVVEVEGGYGWVDDAVAVAPEPTVAPVVEPEPVAPAPAPVPEPVAPVAVAPPPAPVAPERVAEPVVEQETASFPATVPVRPRLTIDDLPGLDRQYDEAQKRIEDHIDKLIEGGMSMSEASDHPSTEALYQKRYAIEEQQRKITIDTLRESMNVGGISDTGLQDNIMRNIFGVRPEWDSQAASILMENMEAAFDNERTSQNVAEVIFRHEAEAQGLDPDGLLGPWSALTDIGKRQIIKDAGDRAERFFSDFKAKLERAFSNANTPEPTVAAPAPAPVAAEIQTAPEPETVPTETATDRRLESLVRGSFVVPVNDVESSKAGPLPKPLTVRQVVRRLSERSERYRNAMAKLLFSRGILSDGSLMMKVEGKQLESAKAEFSKKIGPATIDAAAAPNIDALLERLGNEPQVGVKPVPIGVVHIQQDGDKFTRYLVLETDNGSHVLVDPAVFFAVRRAYPDATIVVTNQDPGVKPLDETSTAIRFVQDKEIKAVVMPWRRADDLSGTPIFDAAGNQTGELSIGWQSLSLQERQNRLLGRPSDADVETQTAPAPEPATPPPAADQTPPVAATPTDQPAPTVTKSGKPFKAAGAARLTATKALGKGNFEVVEVEGGWGYVPASGGMMDRASRTATPESVDRAVDRAVGERGDAPAQTAEEFFLANQDQTIAIVRDDYFRRKASPWWNPKTSPSDARALLAYKAVKRQSDSQFRELQSKSPPAPPAAPLESRRTAAPVPGPAAIATKRVAAAARKLDIDADVKPIASDPAVAGTYDPGTGKVTLYAAPIAAMARENNVSVETETLAQWFHERGLHGGLRLVFPDTTGRDETLRRIFESVGESRIRQEIGDSVADDYVAQADGRIAEVLAEEYLARIAERMGRGETPKGTSRSIWNRFMIYARQTVRRMFPDMKLSIREANHIARRAVDAAFASRAAILSPGEPIMFSRRETVPAPIRTRDSRSPIQIVKDFADKLNVIFQGGRGRSQYFPGAMAGHVRTSNFGQVAEMIGGRLADDQYALMAPYVEQETAPFDDELLPAYLDKKEGNIPDATDASVAAWMTERGVSQVIKEAIPDPTVRKKFYSDIFDSVGLDEMQAVLGDTSIGKYRDPESADSKIEIAQAYVNKIVRRGPDGFESLSDPDAAQDVYDQAINRGRRHLRNTAAANWIAEFIINPDAAKTGSPTFHRYFQKTMPEDIRDAIAEFSTGVRSHYSMTATEKTATRIVTDEKMRKEVADTRVAGAYSTSLFDKFLREVSDTLQPVWSGINRALEIQGRKMTDLLPSKNPKYLFRGLAASTTKFRNFIEKGVQNAFDRHKRESESLDGMIKKLLPPESQRPADFDLNAAVKTAYTVLVNQRVIENGTRLEGQVLAVETALKNIETLEQSLADAKKSFSKINAQIKRLKQGPRRDAAIKTRRTIRKDIMGIESAIRSANRDIQKNMELARYTGDPAAIRQWFDDVASRRISGAGAGLESDIEVARKSLAELKAADPEQFKRMEEFAKDYRNFADAILRYIRDKGMISNELYLRIKDSNEYYANMSRIKPDTNFAVISDAWNRGLMIEGQGLKEFKGSDLFIEDPLASLLNTSYSLMQLADRNQAWQATWDVFIDQREMYEKANVKLREIARETTMDDPHAFKVYFDGMARHIRFEEGIEKAIRLHEKTNEGGMWSTVFQALPKIMRETITKSPPFLLRSFPRDVIQRAIMSKHGSNPLRLIRVLKDIKQAEALFYAGGAPQFGLQHIGIKTMEQYIHDSINKASGRKDTILAYPGKIWDAWGEFAAWTENIGRMEEWAAAKEHAMTKQGLSEIEAEIYADASARDIMDYNVAGHSIRWLNKYIIFTNAAVRGIEKTIRTAKEDPTGMLSRWGLYAGLWQVLAYLWNIWNGDDEELDQQPEYIKDLFLNFKIADDLWLRIPVGWDVALPGAAMVRAMQAVRGKENAFEGYGRSFGNSLTPIDEAALMGPIRPFMEAMTNTDFFRDKQIVPKFEADLALELREGQEYSSRIAKAIQALLPGPLKVDTRKIDHIIQGQFGGLGRIASQIGDLNREDRPRQGIRILTEAAGFFTPAPSSSARDVRAVSKYMDEHGRPNDTRMQFVRDQTRNYYEALDTEARDHYAERARELASRLRRDIEAPGHKSVESLWVKVRDARRAERDGTETPRQKLIRLMLTDANTAVNDLMTSKFLAPDAYADSLDRAIKLAEEAVKAAEEGRILRSRFSSMRRFAQRRRMVAEKRYLRAILNGTDVSGTAG